MSIRGSQEEKQKLLEGTFENAPLSAAQDILPTAESIKWSQEEKEKLIKDAMQDPHVAKVILSSEEEALFAYMLKCICTKSAYVLIARMTLICYLHSIPSIIRWGTRKQEILCLSSRHSQYH